MNIKNIAAGVAYSVLLISSLRAHTFEPFAYVNFAQSMGNVRHQWGNYFKEDCEWESFLREHYEAYNPSKIEPQEESLIPKILHQIWLGSPFPEKYKKWQASWLEHHPDWEYKLWTDENIKELTLQNQDKFDKATSWGTKTDILRFEILYQMGGLYVDTDFECFRSMDLFHHCYSFYFSILPEPNFALCNAFIASVPGHPVLKGLLDSVYVPKNNGWEAVSLSTGPLRTTPVFMNYVTNSDDTSWMAFPCSYLFPVPVNPPKPASHYIKPETYAVHHYEGSWTVK